MEDVTIELQGTPTTPGDTTSLIYLALIGSALATFSFESAVGLYASAVGPTQYAAITRLNLRFADKVLIEQDLTLELQGGMAVTAS